MSRDAAWTIPAIFLVLAQHSAALLISNLVGFTERPPTLSYMLIALVLSFFGGLALFLHRLWGLWREGEDQPIARLRAEAQPIAISTYFLGFQLIALQMAALTWLKEMIPWAAPFWADGPLAAFDRAILGTDVWRIIPAAFVKPLDALYPSWALVKFVALLLILARPASQLKAQAMMAYFLTVGLVGVSGQYLLSSAGPIFYDRVVHASQFGDLVIRLREMAPIASAASEYLWASYLDGGDGIGRGISAMPSMHVALATWIALAMSRIWPKAALLFWGYWAIIMAGSVALGWHYLSDGVVGAGGAILCWRLAPALLAWFARLRSGPADLSEASVLPN